MAIETVAAAVLKHWLSDGDEIALVDVREAGSFADGHAFLAVLVPYSRFELRIGAVAPNRHVRLVLCDDGSGIADLAARRAEGLGFTCIFVLAGGMPAWQAAGYTLYEGVNVPSKTFGELIEEERATPHISADELKAMQVAGEDLVIVDGRTFSEFQRYAIPGGISCANGELALRIDDLAPDPATKIVVNCAGRTRSIIGAQTLIDLGIENQVVALENGTQGWVLAGHELERGAKRRHELALPQQLERRRARAHARAEARGVRFVDASEVAAWLDDQARTTYLFDIRCDEEHAADGPPGFTHAPGGQLIQAADQWMAVRNAHVVVADTELVRAPMVAAWLRELGLDAHVLAGGVAAAAEIDWPERQQPRLPKLAEIDAGALKQRLDAGAIAIFDLRSSTHYRAGHIAQATWTIRPLIVSTPPGSAKGVVLIADEARLARLAAIDLGEAGVWDISYHRGSSDDWVDAGLEIAITPDLPPDSAAIDFVFFTHGRHDGNPEASRQYLAWELGLIGQLDDDERAVFNIAPAMSRV